MNKTKVKDFAVSYGIRSAYFTGGILLLYTGLQRGPIRMPEWEELLRRDFKKGRKKVEKWIREQ